MLALALAVPALALLALPSPAPAADPVPVLETEALFGDEAGGEASADDAAIWVDPVDRTRSLVVGTKKNAGLSVFDLEGRTLQDIAAPPAPGPADAPGRFNNVDLLEEFSVGGARLDFAVVSDRGRDTLRLFEIQGGRTPPLAELTAADAPFVFSRDQAEVNQESTAYGLAVWRRNRRDARALVSRRNGTALAMMRLRATDAGQVTYERVAQVELPSSFTLPDGTTWAPCAAPGEGPQVEGMVVDPRRTMLLAGQEDVGIWAIPLTTSGFGAARLVDRVREYGVPATFDPVSEECVVSGPDPGAGGQRFSADVEGLTIYDLGSADTGYLLVSSQGDNSFAVYGSRGLGPFLGSFRVAAGPVDSVEDSDGAAVAHQALEPRFPGGLLVTQDGENTPEALDAEGEARDNSNFKYTRWEDVAAAFEPPLQVRPR